MQVIQFAWDNRFIVSYCNHGDTRCKTGVFYCTVPLAPTYFQPLKRCLGGDKCFLGPNACKHGDNGLLNRHAYPKLLCYQLGRAIAKFLRANTTNPDWEGARAQPRKRNTDPKQPRGRK